MGYAEISQEMQMLWDRIEHQITGVFDQKASQKSYCSEIAFTPAISLWEGRDLKALRSRAAGGYRSPVVDNWVPKAAKVSRMFALLHCSELNRTDEVDIADWGACFTLNDMATILRAVEEWTPPPDEPTR